MEKTKWTSEQNEAIKDNGCNLLVAAGAGAGKTAVLVERIIQKLLDETSPVDIDQLLVVTFTNAAAAEMRERIGVAIARELEKNPEAKHLQRQLTLLNRANIMTIHSFCLGVIRSNFHLLDIDPNFRVCDETEAVLLKDEVMEELFEDSFEIENHDFITLVKTFGEKDDRRVQGIIHGLYRFAVSTPWPEKWLVEIAEDFNIAEDFDFGASKWCSIITSDIKMELEGCLYRINKASDIIDKNPELQVYRSIFKKEGEFIESLMLCSSFQELGIGFNNISFDRFPSKKLEGEAKELRDKIKDIRDDVKKKLQSISADIFVCGKESNEKLLQMYPLLKTLSDTTIEFNRRFSAKKKEKGIIDFNDIEHFTLDILSCEGEPSETALGYRNVFDEILIDEYQDSNMVQEVIMNMISRNNPGNVFMVGDVKQSIYRFRHAKPELFLNKYNIYGSSIGEPGKKIKLFKNFRSRTEIIDGVNFVFSQLMSNAIGELDYNQEEALEAGAVYSENESSIELHIMDKEFGADEEDVEMEEEELDGIQLEARMAAKRIHELLDSDFKVFDKELKADRKVTYRDMVILMRTTEKWAQIFSEELSSQNIPVFADTSTGYFDATEIKTIMSLLQVIDNPLQDIPLIAVMRSPIFSFTPEELIDIRTVDKKMGFYEICRSGKIENEALSKKTDKFLEKINSWRNKSLYIPVDEFIWYLYSETSYYSFAGSMPQGIQRQANLRLLFERAREYEKTSYKGLFNFINFVNKLRNSSGDLGGAKILGENENVVRIMSIHKSKGLEFPVVFLCGTGKKFNMMDANQSILFHQELGYGPDFVDYERRISYPTLVKHIVKKKIKTETLSEEMRILYVAFTRAKEKLIITGVVKDIRKNCEKWCDGVETEREKLSEYYTLNARCFMDWLGAAAVRSNGGKAIREMGGLKDFHEGDGNSTWNIRIWNKYQVMQNLNEETEKTETADNETEAIDESIEAEVKRRLEWEYKYIKLGHIPAKISVSELKDHSEMQPLTLKSPAFLEGKRITGTERGTLMHLVMQHIDFKRVNTEGIRDQLQQMVLKEFITSEEASAVSVKKISGFFKTSLGKRMISADYIKREVPFFIELNAAEVYRELSGDEYRKEKIMLQGVIDCYFEEQGQLVLVDYKTDYAESSEIIGDKYKKQVEIYASALEKITGKRVKEKYLYLFYNGEMVKIL